MSYFIVFQNKTFKEERDAGILWAPKNKKNGGPPFFHWANMTKLKEGDIVFSVLKNKIMARSIVIEPAKTTPIPFDNDLWQREGWLAKLKYETAINNFKIADEIENIRKYLEERYSPFNVETGRGNQGYLFEITDELGEYLDSKVTLNIEFEHDEVFEIDEEMETIIREVFDEENIDEGEVVLLETEAPDRSNKPRHREQRVYANKTDFIKRAKRDIAIGLIGEELVVEYEKAYLRSIGRDDLADKVKWVAKEADGYGYDVLSFDENGDEKYIEVKTTTIEHIIQPFEVSKNEVETSEKYKDHYWIYRVYDVKGEKPKFYKINGVISEVFEIEPASFKVYIKG